MLAMFGYTLCFIMNFCHEKKVQFPAGMAIALHRNRNRIYILHRDPQKSHLLSHLKIE